jgi:hypothetical protein
LRVGRHCVARPRQRRFFALTDNILRFLIVSA